MRKKNRSIGKRYNSLRSSAVLREAEGSEIAPVRTDYLCVCLLCITSRYSNPCTTALQQLAIQLPASIHLRTKWKKRRYSTEDITINSLAGPPGGLKIPWSPSGFRVFPWSSVHHLIDCTSSQLGHFFTNFFRYQWFIKTSHAVLKASLQ
jgi:hypothetical protein